MPRVEALDHEGELYYITKCLIQYVSVKKTSKASKHATNASVFTSDECAKHIFGQEEEKKKEKEQKEAQKAEQEQKKKEREEDACQTESRKNRQE